MTFMEAYAKGLKACEKTLAELQKRPVHNFAEPDRRRSVLEHQDRKNLAIASYISGLAMAKRCRSEKEIEALYVKLARTNWAGCDSKYLVLPLRSAWNEAQYARDQQRWEEELLELQQRRIREANAALQTTGDTHGSASPPRQEAT